MVIVETNKEKDQFLDYWNNEESTIIPIWEDLERHPMTNGLSFLYVQFRNLDFILPFNHNDCEKLEIDLSTSNQAKWIWNKKGFLQTDIEVKNLKDVQTSLFFEENKLYDIQSKLEVLTNFYHRLGIRDGLGKSIPIMKWGEVLREIVDEFKKQIPAPDLSNQKWVDDTMIPILSDIERRGFRSIGENFLIDGQIIVNHFGFHEHSPNTIHIQ